MATWVPLARVMKFPEVIRVYKKAGRGQGTGQGIIGTGVASTTLVSAPKGFLRTVQNFIQGQNPDNSSTTGAGASWIRKMVGNVGAAGSNNDWQNVQIDVENIPGVRKLRKDGKWAKAS
jgi:hypothetical protein